MRINTKRFFSGKVVFLLVVFGFLVFTPCSAQYINLINFTDTSGSYIGEYPYGFPTLSGDTLYGMTYRGGINGLGNIFSVQTNGTNYKNLIDFTGDTGSYIGAEPWGSLTLSGDTLYGMTQQGGINGDGTIFSVQTNGTNYKDLIDFSGTSGSYVGAQPWGSLTLSGDTLYGMTTAGGIGRIGNIFSVQTNGMNYKDLVEFTDTSVSSLGKYPYGSLTLSGDTLYGMTKEEGINEEGIIFSVQTNGTNYKDLIDFSGTSGSYVGEQPWGSLTLSGDTLYGMTEVGIFSVQTNGTNYKDLIDFTGNSGSYIGRAPMGSLTLSGRTLYGMTQLGGINGQGNIFSVQTNGTNYTDMVDFTGDTGSYLGKYPSGSLTLSGNTLYGMTYLGGVNRYGNIFSFSLLSATTSVIINVTCNGANNGYASVSASGGIPPYTYSWSPNGGSDSIATGLSAGTYTVNVTDSIGLTGSALVTITQPAALSVSGIIINTPHCNGDSTGSAYIVISGGTPPCSYAWNWGVGGFHYASTDTLSGLSAGTYTILVNDSNGCNTKDSAIITQPAAIVGTTTIINPVNTCGGSNSGIISVLVTGGIAPYTYQWSDANNQTTDTAIGLSLGNYTVTITDNTGCSSFASNTFTLPNTAGDSISIISNVSCYGGSNGSATVIIGNSSNVVRNYLFEPAVQHFLVPMGVNTITITIGGAKGGGDSLGGNGASFAGVCPVIPGDIISIAVGQMGAGSDGGGASWVYDSNMVLYNPVGTNGLLAVAGGGGGPGGAGSGIRITTYPGAAGGTNLLTNASTFGPPIEQAGGTGGNGGNAEIGGAGTGWLSNGQNGAGRGRITDTGGRDEANHFLAINGGGGYGGGGADGEYIIGGTQQYSGGGGGGYNGGGTGWAAGGGGSYFINTSPVVTANDTGNGFVTISYSVGGIPPYTYLWSNGETTATATGLSAGTYSVTVSDSSGCFLTDSVTITQPPAIIPTITQYSGVKCNGDSDAVLFASASGGSGFYQYHWSDASSQTNTIATGLSIGTYTVTVTDNNGCTGTANTIITQPPALNMVVDTLADSGSCTGSAWVLVRGGTPSYSYLWTGGLTTDTIINQCAGYFCCTVTDANRCVDSVCVTITSNVSTGINELTTDNRELTVYPNPSNGIFTLQIDNGQWTMGNDKPQVKIYNILGEQIYSQLSIVHFPLSINLSSQANGMYFYRVIRENGGLIGEGKIVIVR
jgi:hypothetical protein